MTAAHEGPDDLRAGDHVKEQTMAEISRLPGPIADLWDWQMDGACRRTNPDVFFHPEGERGPARRGRDEAAKAVCRTCPVLADCRTHALTVREPYGVWGALTEDDREHIYASGVIPRVG
jgi:WhiB family transcriptional regulator, redox-sensing transcriptional regulator